MSAVISTCGRYRYRLDREIAYPGQVVAFMLHNPSTADAERDDPTSRRGVGFARAWGASRLIYVNPWAGRATKPSDLWKMDDPIGPDNDWHIEAVSREVVNSDGFFVFAWGAVSPPVHLRADVRKRLASVEEIVRSAGCDVRALGVTKDGAPRHPLYLRSDAKPMPWFRP